MPEREDFSDEGGFQFQPGVEVEAGASLFGEDFNIAAATAQLGPDFTDSDTNPDNPDTAQSEPKQETKPVREREKTLRPVPRPKTYRFRDGNSPATRAQRIQYIRLCRKLGIPYDVALQTILLFYNTKNLVSARIEELEFIIAFEELMDAYPENTTDILRILHLKTDKMYRDAADNFKDIRESIEEIRKISDIRESGIPDPSCSEPVRVPSGLLAGSFAALLRSFKLFLRKNA